MTALPTFPPSTPPLSPPALGLAGYTKAVVEIVAATLIVLGAAITDNVITQVEAVNIGIAFILAFGVWGVRSAPEGWRRHLKAIVAFTGAALMALHTLLADGVTLSEWITVFLAGIGALGVAVLPNVREVPVASVIPRHG